MRELLSFCMAAAIAVSLGACGSGNTGNAASKAAAKSAESPYADYKEDTSALTFSNTKWNYDDANKVYWRIGVQYCAAPQATKYETMGIYVPGAYFTGVKNSDGTYTCSLNDKGAAAGYSASTAPIVIPVNTPGYSASAAPTKYDYSSVSSYLKAGFVYVQPGIRGRSSMGGVSASDESYSGGAPWGVTDLKAAIRYYRFNQSVLPGDCSKIFSFGMSGGGAQSSLVGATGDSDGYTPYLEAIGAAMYDADKKALSDAVCGSMCWCPITSLDYADEAYEWNMGQFFSSNTRVAASFGSALSKDLAASYAGYLNSLKLKNGNTVLKLKKSDSGVYQAGTYYDYILSVIETSLNHFLSDTTFPYTETQTAQFPGGSTGTSGTAGKLPDGVKLPDGAKLSDGAGQKTGSAATGKTYATAQAYIDSLNSDAKWITYDAASNTAKVTSVKDFVTHCKTASKGLGAFDEVDRGQGENNLFGNGQSQSLHFDAALSKLLKENAGDYAKFNDWKASYLTDFKTDLAVKDSLKTSVQSRVNLYNPMYFLNARYGGYKTSAVAKYWRIRTGIDQSDTALTVEANLALALKSNSKVKDVDFATVWGMKHVEAERTGDSTTNFISWVNQCAAQ